MDIELRRWSSDVAVGVELQWVTLG